MKRFVSKKEKDARREAVLKTQFSNPKNYKKMDVFDPIETWQKKLVIIPKECVITGDKIPAFSYAWRRCLSYYVRDIVNDQYTWYSEKGYSYWLLKHGDS